MSFLNPWFAAALAAVVVPALLILYFLKLRRREQLVPSTLLWKRAVQDLQVNAPFQRLRRNLLLLLQLLILIAAILALARPIVQSSVTDADRVVLLLDRSASMQAREGDRTRLDEAKEQATRLVRTFNRRAQGWRSFFTFGGAEARTQVMLIAFSDRATILSPFTTNTADLADVIERLEPTDGRTDLREAIGLAEAYLSPPTRSTDQTPVSAESPPRLVLISDGRIPDLARTSVRGGTLELLRVGRAEDNVGITVLRTQRNYEQPERVEVFLTVENFGPDPVSTDITLHVDGKLRAVEALELTARPPEWPPPGARSEEAESAPAGGNHIRALSFPVLLDRAAVVEARLSRPDALGVDNTATAVVPAPRRQRVLVVTDGQFPFLDSVIRGLPLQEFPFVTPAQYEAGEGGPYESDGQSTYDVVIFDKYVPTELPAGNYLFLGAIPRDVGIEDTGETAIHHPLIWWDETHPILRYVSLDFVYVAESRLVKVPPSAETLVEGPRGPVLFRYATKGRQYLVLTFPVEASTWWSKLSFGVFIYNAIRYLGGGESEDGGRPIRPGEPLRIPFPPDKERLQLVRPDKSRVSVRADAYGVAYYDGTERVGLYEVEDGLPGRSRFAVNLEDAWESDIRVPEKPPEGGPGAAIRELAAIRTATPEVWRWFVGGALLILLIEWWVYNRRVML